MAEGWAGVIERVDLVAAAQYAQGFVRMTYFELFRCMRVAQIYSFLFLWLFPLLPSTLFLLESVECESRPEAQARVTRAQKKATSGTWSGCSQRSFIGHPTTLPALCRGALRLPTGQAAKSCQPAKYPFPCPWLIHTAPSKKHQGEDQFFSSGNLATPCHLLAFRVDLLTCHQG